MTTIPDVPVPCGYLHASISKYVKFLYSTTVLDDTVQSPCLASLITTAPSSVVATTYPATPYRRLRTSTSMCVFVFLFASTPDLPDVSQPSLS